MGETGDEFTEAVAAHTPLFWGLSVLLYGIGDTATTTVGIVTGTGKEAGPLAAGALASYGLPGLLGLKLASMLAFYLAWRAARPPGRVAVPLALVVVGAAVTVWNGVVLVT